MFRIGFLLGVLLMIPAFFSTPVMAQRETDTGILVEKDIELIRRDLRGEKKQIIAMNVPFTELEAQKFWPIYDQYSAEMKKQNDDFYALIKDYVANQKVMTDEQSMGMIKQWAVIQGEQAKVRQKYIPLFEKVVPGKKVALFFQIDRRLYALIDLQVASELPLVYKQ